MSFGMPGFLTDRNRHAKFQENLTFETPYTVQRTTTTGCIPTGKTRKNREFKNSREPRKKPGIQLQNREIYESCKIYSKEWILWSKFRRSWKIFGSLRSPLLRTQILHHYFCSMLQIWPLKYYSTETTETFPSFFLCIADCRSWHRTTQATHLVRICPEFYRRFCPEPLVRNCAKKAPDSVQNLARICPDFGAYPAQMRGRIRPGFSPNSGQILVYNNYCGKGWFGGHTSNLKGLL